VRYRLGVLTGKRQGIKALRHTVASEWAAAGVHPALAKALMGHSTDITGGYQHPRVEELRRAQEALPWYARLIKRASQTGAKLRLDCAVFCS
jgi:integrase